MDKEKNIIDSWQVNSGNWIDLINQQGIESRVLVTNKAILDAVIQKKPRNILDIGCGEGWLSRSLSEIGIKVTGVDVATELVRKANAEINGKFFVASYEDIANHKVRFDEVFDVIVINFALIGKDSTEQLLASLPELLSDNGVLLVQTLHPYSRKALNDYVTGWKQGSWDGLKGAFTQPYEWYFRTLEDWKQLLGKSGFKNINVSEFFHPVSQAPLSVIFEVSTNQATSTG